MAIMLLGKGYFTVCLGTQNNIPELNRHVPENLLEVNSQTAENLNIVDGDRVKVNSLRGSIETRVCVTDRIDSRVVHLFFTPKRPL
jgi:predicted molibdopterin-dependent oxidoreductase YjgC